MDWKDVWVEKYRPKTLEDIILSDELKTFLVKLKEDSKDTGAIPNLLFSGPAGCGKTSLAKIIAVDVLDCQHLYINGSEETSIEVVRNKIMGFAQTKSIDGKVKLIILDEADGLSNSNAIGRSSAQQALKNVIEEYSNNTRFIFTTNHPDKICEAIHSRLLHFSFYLDEKECFKQALLILKREGVTLPPEQVPSFKQLIKKLAPDLRNIIIQLQKSSVDGVLNIGSVHNYKEFYKFILDSLFEGKDLFELRESIIKNEDNFNIDYHDLLTGMFNMLLNGYKTLPQSKKIQMCLMISDSIVDHFTVSDKEINFSACLFKLSQIG
jgi:replication factor C small subunit